MICLRRLISAGLEALYLRLRLLGRTLGLTEPTRERIDSFLELGTRLGSGCTSGHGVCGLARGSKRSLVSTAIYMGVAVATLFVVRHVIGG